MIILVAWQFCRHMKQSTGDCDRSGLICILPILLELYLAFWWTYLLNFIKNICLSTTYNFQEILRIYFLFIYLMRIKIGLNNGNIKTGTDSLITTCNSLLRKKKSTWCLFNILDNYIFTLNLLIYFFYYLGMIFNCLKKFQIHKIKIQLCRYLNYHESLYFY